MPQQTGMIIGAGVILLYTILGGFNAVVWTDVVQALIMILVLLLLPILGLIEIFHTDPATLHTYTSTTLSLTGGKTGAMAYGGNT